MEEKVRVYFWPYDIFGYLLPGLVLFALFAVSNTWGDSVYGQAWLDGNWQQILVIVAFAYVAGHVLAAAGSYLIERVFLRKTLGWPTQRMFEKNAPSGRLATFALWIVPGYERAYSQTFQKRVGDTIERLYGGDAGDYHDWFWLAWSKVSLSHPAGFRRATHFLELYGFNRNLCMSFLIAAGFPFLDSWSSPVAHKWLWSVTCLAGSLLLFTNYAKLLRRLNDEVYRAFVVVTSETPS